LRPQKQLKDLDLAGTLANDDLIYAAQDGAEKKLSIAQLASYVQAPMAKGISPDAGKLTGTETLPASRGAGLLQTEVGSIAVFARQRGRLRRDPDRDRSSRSARRRCRAFSSR
jgi:hypothetical protein